MNKLCGARLSFKGNCSKFWGVFFLRELLLEETGRRLVNFEEVFANNNKEKMSDILFALSGIRTLGWRSATDPAKCDTVPENGEETVHFGGLNEISSSYFADREKRRPTIADGSEISASNRQWTISHQKIDACVVCTCASLARGMPIDGQLNRWKERKSASKLALLFNADSTSLEEVSLRAKLAGVGRYSMSRW